MEYWSIEKLPQKYSFLMKSKHYNRRQADYVRVLVMFDKERKGMSGVDIKRIVRNYENKNRFTSSFENQRINFFGTFYNSMGGLKRKGVVEKLDKNGYMLSKNIDIKLLEMILDSRKNQVITNLKNICAGSYEF